MIERPETLECSKLDSEHVILNKETYNYLCACREEHEDREYNASVVAMEMLEEYLNEHEHDIRDVHITVEDHGGLHVNFTANWTTDESKFPRVGNIHMWDETSNSPGNALRTFVVNMFNSMWEESSRSKRAMIEKYCREYKLALNVFQIVAWISVLLNILLLV